MMEKGKCRNNLKEMKNKKKTRTKDEEEKKQTEKAKRN
jgi:hypothetical protein